MQDFQKTPASLKKPQCTPCMQGQLYYSPCHLAEL